MSVEPRDVSLQMLAAVLAPDQLLWNPVDLLTYDGDAGLDKAIPDGVVFPRTPEDVVRIVQWANAQQVPLIARGAGTGLSGGAVAEHGGLIVSFSRMDQILNFDVIGRSIVAQPGVITLTIEELVRTKDLYYPPDPSSGRASTLGGNLAENAGGPHCFKYGVTTNYVTGLEVVLADGQQVRFGGDAFDYPEYDLVGLLVGNEGTLGLITTAYLRLIRNPPAVQTLMAAFDTVEQAGRAVSAIIAQGLVPATLEMMDQKIMGIIEDFAHPGLPIHAGAALIIEADGYAESVLPQIEEISTILRAHKAHSLRIAQTAAERAQIWYARKSAAGAMARLAPAFYLVDGTVPRSHLAATLAQTNRICEAYNLRVGYVFHAGDGNLHPLILIEDPKNPALVQQVIDAGHDIMQACVQAGGSITGEHGVGIEKRAFMPLMYSPEEIEVMRDIKAVFDPEQRLNPAKIFPPDTPPAPPLPEPGIPPTSPFTPTSAAEAAAAIQAWTAAQQRIRIQGGGTRSAWLPPTEALLSTRNLRGITICALEDLYVTVRAGTPLSALQTELARHKMWVPLIAPWPESTIGGIVATNLNAPLRMRYGGIRDNVLAMTMVLPYGRVIRAGRSVVKNVAGYDLPRLFVGAYGTLGLITDVTLKLAPVPRVRTSLVVPVELIERGLDWGARLLRGCLVASSLLLVGHWAMEEGPLSTIGGDAASFLIYTVEGLTEDVYAELDQAQTILRKAGAPLPLVSATLAGSDVWATFIRTVAATDGAMRIGVAPGKLPSLLSAMNPDTSTTPFLADLVSGLLYLRGVDYRAEIGQTATAAGGYAVAITMPLDIPPSFAPWTYTPAGLKYMRALKNRWDRAELFNPGAFFV